MTDHTTTDRLREAVEILREHNRWRRGAEDLMQLTPGKIGAAIDTICDLVPPLLAQKSFRGIPIDETKVGQLGSPADCHLTRHAE
jgi:hypothetical protein